MTRLKYIDARASRKAAHEPSNASDTGASSLRFPGSVRDVLSRPDPRVMDHEDLVRSIDRTLDRMQDALSALTEDLNGSYRLEDFRPGGRGPNPAA